MFVVHVEAAFPPHVSLKRVKEITSCPQRVSVQLVNSVKASCHFLLSVCYFAQIFLSLTSYPALSLLPSSFSFVYYYTWMAANLAAKSASFD